MYDNVVNCAKERNGKKEEQMAIQTIYWEHLSLRFRGPVEIMYITCIYYQLASFEMHFLPASLALRDCCNSVAKSAHWVLVHTVVERSQKKFIL